MSPSLRAALLRTLNFVLWALLSAWLFVILEYTETDDRDEKYQLLLSLYEFLASKYNMSIEEFNNISNAAYDALSEPKPQWTYHAAVDFVIQAMTTIGYGYITPQTPAGQILCICVSLLGIPITLLALKSVGELIATWLTTFVTKFEKKIFKRLEPKKLKAKSAVILFIIMVVLIMLSSLSLVHFVEWSFVEGVYFWFITFSTIGFGDYVLRWPRRITQLTLNSSTYHKNENESLDREQTALEILEDLLGTFCIIVALCIVSSVLNSIMMALEERKCHRPCPGCVPRKIQNQVDNDQHIPEQGEANSTNLSMENYGFQKDNMVSVSETELK